jgi:hypothetical protein
MDSDIDSTESAAKNEYALFRHNNSSFLANNPYEAAFAPAFSCDLAIVRFGELARLRWIARRRAGRCVRLDASATA